MGKFLTTTEAGLLNTLGVASTMVPAALTPGYNPAEPLTSGASTAERLRAIYSNDPSLPAKTFQLNAHYQFPFGKGQRYLGNAHGIVNALVSGYNISPFFLWHQRIVLLAILHRIRLEYSRIRRRHYPRAWQNWNSAGKQENCAAVVRCQRMGSDLRNPVRGQTYERTTSLQGDYRNNIPQNYMTGPGFNNLDANVYKLTPIWRNLVFDMEAQILQRLQPPEPGLAK